MSHKHFFYKITNLQIILKISVFFIKTVSWKEDKNFFYSAFLLYLWYLATILIYFAVITIFNEKFKKLSMNHQRRNVWRQAYRVSQNVFKAKCFSFNFPFFSFPLFPLYFCFMGGGGYETDFLFLLNARKMISWDFCLLEKKYRIRLCVFCIFT